MLKCALALLGVLSASSALAVFPFKKVDKYIEKEDAYKKNIAELSAQAVGSLKRQAKEIEEKCESRCHEKLEEINICLLRAQEEIEAIEKECSVKRDELSQLDQAIEKSFAHIASFDDQEVVSFLVRKDVYDLDRVSLRHPCVCSSALTVMLTDSRYAMPKDEEKQCLILSKRAIDQEIFPWIYNFILHEGKIEGIENLSPELALILYKRSDYYSLLHLMKALEEEFGRSFFKPKVFFSFNGEPLNSVSIASRPDFPKWLASLSYQQTLDYIQDLFINFVLKDRVFKRDILRMNTVAQRKFLNFWLQSFRCWFYLVLEPVECRNAIERQEKGDVVRTLEWRYLCFGQRSGYSNKSYIPSDVSKCRESVFEAMKNQMKSFEKIDLIQERVFKSLQNILVVHNPILAIRESASKDNICFKENTEACTLCQRSPAVVNFFSYSLPDFDSSMLKIWNSLHEEIQGSFPN